MKLSAFPNFPDLNATPPAPGAGAAPFSELEAESTSTGDSPPSDTSRADFAAIFGGIAQSTQNGCELPKPIAAGLVNEATRASRQPDPLTEGDTGIETSLEAGVPATTELNESGLTPRGQIEKPREPRRGSEQKPRSHFPAEQAAWAHAFATPTAFAATPAQDCALPLPDEFEVGQEDVEHGSKPAGANADAAALVFAAQRRTTPLSIPRDEFGEVHGKDNGLEQRGAQSLFSPAATTPPSFSPGGNPTQAGRLPEPLPRSIPTHVSRSPESSAVLLPDDLSASPESGDASQLPPSIAAASTAFDARGAVTRQLRSELAPAPGLAQPDARANPSGHELEQPASAAMVANQNLDTARINAPHALRENLGVSHGRVPTGASQAEKLSGATSSPRPEGKTTNLFAAKSFLETAESNLTKESAKVGTGGAKPGASMSAATLSHREPSASAAETALAPAFDVGSDTVTADMTSIESTAQDAVETIRSLAERVASADAQSINLRFSIGESDLRVRVGYWGDEVRTTFLTESPELRAALLQEWQSLSSPAADRASVRFAEPVFASAGQGDAANSSFDSASQQHRESAARRETPSTPAGFFRPRVSDSFTTPASPIPVRGSQPPGSTQRLHTFA